MLPTFIEELSGVLFTMKQGQLLETFSISLIPTSSPIPSHAAMLLANLLEALKNFNSQFTAWMSQRQALLQFERTCQYNAEFQRKDFYCVPSSNVTVYRPFMAKSDVNLGESIDCGLPFNVSRQALNLKVETESLEAVNLSVTTSPTCLAEALNLSVATSPAGLNLSVATSPCFNTADINVGNPTDFKTFLEVGGSASTECWDHVNLDGNTNATYFEPVNDHSNSTAGFAHDGDIFNITLRQDQNPPLCFDIPREEMPEPITEAESVALTVLEELPLHSAALDLSQSTASYFIPTYDTNHVFFEKPLTTSNAFTKVRKSYSCNECSKTFQWKKSLCRHIVKHENVRSLCHVCGKSFIGPILLQKHVAKHTVGKFVCSICGRRFVEASKLKRHSAVHRTNEFSCSICGKAFSREDLLKRHTDIIHLKTRRFPCDFCSKVFSVKCNLDAHEDSVHGGEPMKCDICDKTCKNKATFRVHLKTHKIPPFSCQICKRRFHRKSQLSSHTQNRHKPH